MYRWWTFSAGRDESGTVWAKLGPVTFAAYRVNAGAWSIGVYLLNRSGWEAIV